MSKDSLLKATYFTGFSLTIGGVFLKVQQYGGSNFLLIPALACTLIFMIMALGEIIKSPNLLGREKLMWIIGLLATNGFAGLAYVLGARKRIIGK